jgi:hypothetical protein
MKRIVILLFLSGLCPAQPEILWERTYFPGHVSWFTDVHETADHGFITAMWRPGSDNFCVARFDSDGNWLWSSGDIWYSQAANWIEELTDGTLIVTGVCKETSASDWSLFIAILDSSGGSIWSKIYDEPGSWDEGYCVLPLPDGGFAVVGVKDPDSGMDQAWILRTDSQGDTLWTRVWGWEYNDEARRVLLVDGALTVLMHGRLESTSYGPHIVRYDLDGNLLWETPIPELYGYVYRGQDMCYSPADGGYFVLTHHGPWLAHTDSLGVLQWLVPGRGASNPLGYSINTTMDQGVIYAGQSTPDPDIPGTIYSGMIVRYDSSGNEVWWDYVYNSDCDGLFSARQLSSGGYIACGIANGYPSGQGYLIRYAPELGVEGGPDPGLRIDLGCNPFSSVLPVGFTLPCDSRAEVCVYDLSGRLVERLVSGTLPAGEYRVSWSPGAGVPPGCYFVVLDTEYGRVAVRCVSLW